VVGLQTGVGAKQSALVRHATHSFDTVSQAGVAGLVQSDLATQGTHEPVFINPVVATHAGPSGLPAQSALVAHGRQVCGVPTSERLQVGNIPAQSALNSQLTQVPVG
jgi:hypothetical protein